MTTIRAGIDCASKITADVAKKLLAHSFKPTFIARYLVPQEYEWKRLSPTEAKIISDAGFDILSVFETSADRALSGFDGGVTDARKSIQEAARVAQPVGSAIYFAVDFDVTKPDQMNQIEQYFRGVSSILSTRGPQSYGVGIYGEYDVVDEMLKRGVVQYSWQTYAWSGKKTHPKANVYQFKNGQSMGGITVDLNNSFGNEGFWNLKPQKTQIPFTDVPSDHWTKEALELLKSKGLIHGYSDGTFRGDNQITRYEFAAALAVFYSEVMKNVK